jgi:hypothetical protein
VSLVKITSGKAIVWFDGTAITGISFGPNTAIELIGNIRDANGLGGFAGPIVGNLTASGRLSDSDNDPSNGEDGGVLLPNNLLGLKVEQLGTQLGNVGAVITGGSIQNVSVSGGLGGLYAGDGVFQVGSHYRDSDTGQVSVAISPDYDPFTPGAQRSVTLVPAQALTVPGASVKNVVVSTAVSLQIFAGN